MNENFLTENPLSLFDELDTIPDEAFEYSATEVVSLTDSILESEEYSRTLVNIYETNPEEIYKYLSKFKTEQLKARNGGYPQKKAALIDYLMTKSIAIMEEIIAYRGVFQKVGVRVFREDENVKLPTYADTGAAGMDIYSNQDKMLLPSETAIISTGLKAVIPGGYEIQIRPRSGLSKKTGLRIPNSPATIDASYRGEIGVLVQNTSNEKIEIKKGDKIAQMVLNKVPRIEWKEVNEEEFQSFATERGNGGFGSTGVREDGKDNN